MPLERRPTPAPPTHVHRRSVTSLYSNLVTRPTGRAIRTGVESQLAEMEGGPAPWLSILDFSQVRVLDYSCADEIVAKLLLRFLGGERPADAFFVVRGIQEHHEDAIEAVLERHSLLLVAEDDAGVVKLLGAANPVHRAAWDSLSARGTARADEVAADTGLSAEAVEATLAALVAHRVAVRHPDGAVSPLSLLLEEEEEG
ncbi:MAG TPA: hypothetical protein VFQ39_06925 [Longimicrobium sp.]|nr:hypothetical protein [Longimicrobium sp.]